jgi:hypothetical protein
MLPTEKDHDEKKKVDHNEPTKGEDFDYMRKAPFCSITDFRSRGVIRLCCEDLY